MYIWFEIQQVIPPQEDDKMGITFGETTIQPGCLRLDLIEGFYKDSFEIKNKEREITSVITSDGVTMVNEKYKDFKERMIEFCAELLEPLKEDTPPPPVN